MPKKQQKNKTHQENGERGEKDYEEDIDRSLGGAFESHGWLK